MDNNYYQIYLDSVTQLASSLVIKSAETADAINIGLRITYGDSVVDQNDPTSWKYYKNLVGQYHSTDAVMTVVSVDTLQTIDFTRENLQFHRGTAKAYSYGTTQYKELVNRYPEQEQLILGVLYPASDIQSCIDAENGTILSYPPELIEEWEYSLIPNLQKWIYSYLDRWFNVQYTISDNMYTMTVLGIMYMNLIPAIMLARLSKVKTNEAHTYHVRQYLASNGQLDAFLPYLTRKQALWLYRNIAYIYRNSGQRQIFEWLIANIMTDRGLPIARFEMRHDLSEQPTNLKPTLSFEKIPINTESNYDQVNEYNLTAIFDKEAPLARDNEKYRDEEQARAQLIMQYSKSNRLSTKLLESTIIDYSGSEKYNLADTLFNHWIWLSHTGDYRAFVQVTSPVTNETLSLTAKEAFEFYVYAFCAVQGFVLEKLPIVGTKRVIRTPRPSLADIESATDVSMIGTDFPAQMLALLPVPQVMISVDSFYQYCVSLQRAAMQQYYITVQETNKRAYGLKWGAVNRCWADVRLQTGDHPNQFYADWFAQRNILIGDYNQSHLETIANSLISAATGVNSAAAITLKDIQSAMIRLMTQLSSYSVQYISHINDGPVRDADSGSIRYEDFAVTVKPEITLPINMRHAKLIPVPQGEINYDLSPDQAWTNETKTEMTGKLEEGVDFKFAPNSWHQNFTMRAACAYSYSLGPLPPEASRLTPVIGLDGFMTLPPETRAELLTLPPV